MWNPPLQAHFTCSPFGPEVREVVQALPMDTLDTSNNPFLIPHAEEINRDDMMR
jgi:hypothetical protein